MKAEPVRLAFDLDNTLIRSAHPFPLETPRLGWLARLLGHEPLRQGTAELLRHCRQQGWELRACGWKGNGTGSECWCCGRRMRSGWRPCCGN